MTSRTHICVAVGLIVLSACQPVYRYSEVGHPCDERRPLAPPQWRLAARRDSLHAGGETGGLVLRVRDRDSEQVIDTATVALLRQGRAVAPTTNSASGWGFTHLASERHEVMVRRVGYYAWRGKADVRAGHVDTLTVRLGRLARCIE